MLDESTEFGQRVNRRLREEPIIWLTTVGSDGTPQPRPVWFLYDGESFLIFSRPEGAKMRHAAANPRVALNLDGDGHGGDIIVIIGEAEILQGDLPDEQVEAYVEKYRAGFRRIGMSAEEFAQQYSVALRVKPSKLRGH